jgi:hypothetical protein
LKKSEEPMAAKNILKKKSKTKRKKWQKKIRTQNATL